MLDTIITNLPTLTDAEFTDLRNAVGAEARRRLPLSTSGSTDIGFAAYDTVRIRTNLRPKYLHGRRGKLIKVNQTTADVKLFDITGIPTTYLRNGDTVRVPMKCLEVER